MDGSVRSGPARPGPARPASWGMRVHGLLSRAICHGVCFVAQKTLAEGDGAHAAVAAAVAADGPLFLGAVVGIRTPY